LQEVTAERAQWAVEQAVVFVETMRREFRDASPTNVPHERSATQERAYLEVAVTRYSRNRSRNCTRLCSERSPDGMKWNPGTDIPFVSPDLAALGPGYWPPVQRITPAALP
jgi:hypothetical protein